MMNDNRLSVCIIAKNEEKIIGRCIESVLPTADEIIVVDTGSTDETASIAKNLGAKVINSDWRNDFSYSRNISIKAASFPWILWLDADDVVPMESCRKLNELKRENTEFMYGMVVENQNSGNTGTQFMQVRMFPNRSELFFERPIHEQVAPSGLRAGLIIKNTDIVIEHHGYANPADMPAKCRRNISMLLENYDGKIADPYLFIELADSYSILGEKESARTWYEKVISIASVENKFPDIFSQALLGMANFAIKEEQYNEAVLLLKKASKASPNRTDVLYLMAVSFDMLGKKDLAIELLMRIVDMPFVTLKVGVDYRGVKVKAIERFFSIVIDTGEYSTVEKIVDKCMVEYSNEPSILNLLGRFYYNRKDYLNSARSFERSLSVMKDGNLEAQLGLCSVFIKIGRRELAHSKIMNIKNYYDNNYAFIAYLEAYGFEQCITKKVSNFDRELIENEKKIILRFYK